MVISRTVVPLTEKREVRREWFWRENELHFRLSWFKVLVESPLGKFIIHLKQKTKENMVRSEGIDSELTYIEIIIEAMKMDKIIE